MAAVLGLIAVFLPQEAKEASVEYSVSVTTRNGTAISGAASFGSLRITGDLGTQDLDASKIRWLNFEEPRDHVELKSSSLSGKIEIADFTLRSEYGTFRIGRAKLRRVDIAGPWTGEKPAAALPPDSALTSNHLKPAATATVPERAGTLLLVPDESALLLHDEGAQKLLRYNAATLKLETHVVDVWKGFRGLRVSADRRHLYGFGAVEGAVSGGRFAAYEDQGRKLAWSVPLDFEPVDVVASPKGRVFILGKNPAPLIAVLDPVGRKVVSRWGGMPPGSRILAAPDGQRVYVLSDEGTTGKVSSVWLTGPEYGKPLAPREIKMDGRVRVGTPALIAQGRYLVSGRAVMRLAATPEDDLAVVARIEPAISLAEFPSKNLVIASTASSLQVLGGPDFSILKSFAPEFRLADLSIDRAGRLFALTRAQFQSGAIAMTLVRHDLAEALSPPAASKDPVPAPPSEDAAEIPRITLRDATGGAPSPSKIVAAPAQPVVKTGQPCPTCEGKGQVKIDRPGEDGVILRRHQACARCRGSGKMDLLTCDACLGQRRLRLAIRVVKSRSWTVVEVTCRRCPETGLVGRPQTVPAAEAGKPVKCVGCGGASQVRMQKIKDGYGTELKGDCLDCGGKGSVIRSVCLACEGTGAREERITCDVEGERVEKGVPAACGECSATGIKTGPP